MGNVSNAGFDVISGRSYWHGYLAWQPNNGISNALGLGIHCPDSVTLVGVQGSTKVPAIDTVGCPGGPLYTWFFVNDDLCARWAMGVQLKSKGPNNWAQAKSRGLRQEPWRRFKVDLACGMR